jgi:hypothetical protein
MRPVCRTIDLLVAVVDPYTNFSLCADTTHCIGEVEIRCARSAAASETLNFFACRHRLLVTVTLPDKTFNRTSPAPQARGACKEQVGIAHYINSG